MSWSLRVLLVVAAVCSTAYLTAFGLELWVVSRRSGDTLGLTGLLLAFAGLLNFPLWLPATIPNRFPRLSRVVRSVCAVIIGIPFLMFTASEGFIVSACCAAAIVILLWPEIRPWLESSGPAMNQDNRTMPKSIWQRALIGFRVLFVIIILLGTIDAAYIIYDHNTTSKVWIRNWSGSDLRFEEVTIDDKPIWNKPDVVIKTIKNFQEPLLDTRGDKIALGFRAPKKEVELKLVTLNEMQEKETVVCRIDNRLRPCFFQAYYYKGRLVCHQIEYQD
ncbi:MAG: hypothetical protein ACOYXY_09260 [Thermodesulfobacteriota bacterium]